MAKGKINLQAADGAVIGLVVPDGLASEERQIALGVNLSGITAYHLLQGNLAVSNSTITQGFNTTLYTLNGAVQVVNTGIDMSTQWGNTAEETFGGLVWQKTRTGAEAGHRLCDTVRGVGNVIYTNATNAQTSEPNSLSTFSSTGFSGGGTSVGASGALSTSWNFQTTHRVSGTTNHGKAYTCHYNPFTGFTIVKYEGSGLAGHEIPHHLGRKLGFCVTKSLSGAYDWVANAADKYLYLNKTDASPSNYVASNETVHFVDGTGAAINASANTYIMHGWANSYFDESNKLIGYYELVPYQGTGAAGNKVKTRGKPAWVMTKRVDAVSNWYVSDNQRGSGDNLIQANTTAAEEIGTDIFDYISDGFIHKSTATTLNAAGGQYIALVAYDTNSNGGGSYYPLASDTANVQINNALIPLAQGIDSNGAKNTILSKNETITGLNYTQGKNYVYCDKNGSYGVTPYKPRYLESELVRTYASEAPEYYDVVKNKWFSTDNGTPVYTNTGNTVAGWFKYSGGATTLTTDGSILTTTWDGTATLYANYLLTGLTIGKTYTAEVSVSSITSEGHIIIGDASLYGTTNLHDAGAYAVGNTITSGGSGKSVVKFTANGTSVAMGLRSNGNGGNIKWDSISVFPTDIVPTTEITNSRNYLNHIVHADNDGGVLYVEELPKTVYFDEVKANEFRGKNACTAWVNFDGTTTPPTIRDSYNVSAVIRTSAGVYDIYFKESMDNVNYNTIITSNFGSNDYSHIIPRTLNKVTVATYVSTSGANANYTYNNVHIDGGKN